MGNRCRGRVGLGRVRYSSIGAIGVVLGLGCSSSTSSGPTGRRVPIHDSGPEPACTPGETRTCFGPGACRGGQACGADSQWGSCDCGAAGAGGGSPGGAGSGDGGSGAGGIASGGVGGASGGALGVGGRGGGLAVDAAVCGFDLPSVAQPVDLYVMFDQSSSMSSQVPGSSPAVSWWETAQQAFASFVDDPRAAGTGVGLQFFPYHGLTDPNRDPSSPSSSCYVPNYETPEVEIGALPANSAAPLQSMQSHAPTTFTPTAAALQGAIQHMQAWGRAHPGRFPAVVLVTDGYPTECDPQDPALIAQLAQQAYQGTPRVLTFVIGFEDGGALDNLNQIAKAGGTSAAVLIGGGNIASQFVDAMNAIPRSLMPCVFDPQTSPPLDLAKVWVEHVPTATGIPMPVPRVNTAGDCASANEGWYFDAPPPASTKVVLCPQTCQQLAAGSIHIVFGCGPNPPPTP